MKSTFKHLLASLALGASTQLTATVVSTDFNDLAVGELRPDPKRAPAVASGQGFATPTWMTGSGIPRIVPGDLAAPASTGYALKQSGTPRSFQALKYKVEDATDRRQGRALATKLTGTVWLSFLVKNADANQAVSLDFNAAPQQFSAPQPTRIVVEGADVRIYNAAKIKSGEVVGAVTPGQTALILVRIDIAAAKNGKNDQISLWVNPTLARTPEELAKPQLRLLDTGFIGSSRAISTLGIASYDLRTGANQVGGVLDAVTLADGPDGYAAVTGLRP